jgi:glutamate-5-semialdehyde dehydrogenase
MLTIGFNAKQASTLVCQSVSAAAKNKALLALARLLREHIEPLQADNALRT